MPPVPAKKAAPAAKKAAATKKAPPSAQRRDNTLPPQIRSLSRSRDGFIRMIVFGEPGVGKTPFAASAPNALILDGDGGLESALASGSTAKVWPLDDWHDADAAYQWLRSGGHKEFDWLVLDGITLFQERGLDMIMDDLVVKKPHRSVYLPDKGEYGQNMSHLTRFLRDLKKLPINQIWTAHTFIHEVDMPDGSTMERFMPQVQGRGLTQKVCGYVGIVAHIETVESKKNPGEEYPVLTASKAGGWYGKDRYGAIGRMARPTVPKVVAAIEAKLDPTKKENT